MSTATEALDLLDRYLTLEDVRALPDEDRRKLARLLHHWHMLARDDDRIADSGQRQMMKLSIDRDIEARFGRAFAVDVALYDLGPGTFLAYAGRKDALAIVYDDGEYTPCPCGPNSPDDFAHNATCPLKPRR